jgi:hypothetical protein
MSSNANSSRFSGNVDDVDVVRRPAEIEEAIVFERDVGQRIDIGLAVKAAPVVPAAGDAKSNAATGVYVALLSE